MKRLILFPSLILMFCVSFAHKPVQGTLPTVYVSGTSTSNTVDFGGVNLTPIDSLLVSDTLTYILPVSHMSNVNPFITSYWSKILSGTATVTVNFLQANDPVSADFVTIKKGKNLTAYTKTLNLSASGWSNISFVQDTAKFEGRYLMVQFVTSSTASVKGKIFNRIRFNQN